MAQINIIFISVAQVYVELPNYVHASNRDQTKYTQLHTQTDIFKRSFFPATINCQGLEHAVDSRL